MDLNRPTREAYNRVANVGMAGQSEMEQLSQLQKAPETLVNKLSQSDEVLRQCEVLIEAIQSKLSGNDVDQKNPVPLLQGVNALAMEINAKVQRIYRALEEISGFIG